MEVIPDPFTDESLRGYLARLAAENGISIMRFYKEMCLNSGKHLINYLEFIYRNENFVRISCIQNKKEHRNLESA